MPFFYLCFNINAAISISLIYKIIDKSILKRYNSICTYYYRGEIMNFESNKNFYAIWAKGNALYAKASHMLGVGYPELVVLYALKTGQNQTQKDISTGFGLLKSTVNTVIRELKQRGYVVLTFSDKDKRERLVSLTETGKKYCDELIEPVLDMEYNVYKIFGEERLKLTQELMELYNTLFRNELERGLKK